MGNIFIHCCTPVGKTVRVYRDKGRLMEFYSAVPASKIMEEYPNHLLVYRSLKIRPQQSTDFLSRKAVGQQVDIRVMRFSDMLSVGQVYFLVHIPQQYLARFAKYFNIQSTSREPPPVPTANGSDRPKVKENTLGKQLSLPMESPPHSTGADHPSAAVSEDLLRNQLRTSPRRMPSPKRASKVGGKPSRSRRGGSRSPSHKMILNSRVQGCRNINVVLIESACSSAHPLTDRLLPHRLPEPKMVGNARGPVSGKSYPSRGFVGFRYRRYSRRLWRPVLESISEMVD